MFHASARTPERLPPRSSLTGGLDAKAGYCCQRRGLSRALPTFRLRCLKSSASPSGSTSEPTDVVRSPAIALIAVAMQAAGGVVLGRKRFVLWYKLRGYCIQKRGKSAQSEDRVPSWCA